jgi:hypothetical protein
MSYILVSLGLEDSFKQEMLLRNSSPIRLSVSPRSESDLNPFSVATYSISPADSHSKQRVSDLEREIHEKEKEVKAMVQEILALDIEQKAIEKEFQVEASAIESRAFGIRAEYFAKIAFLKQSLETVLTRPRYQPHDKLSADISRLKSLFLLSYPFHLLITSFI